MILRDKASIYVNKRVSDGYGGHEEKEVFIKDIECKIISMDLRKQSAYFGSVSVTALSIITGDCLGSKDIVKIDNTCYEIINISKALKKYVIDLEVKSA